MYYGALNKNELNRIQKHLDLFQNIPIDRLISEQFIQLMAQYSLSHKLTIPDAMIAATALTHNLSLYTLNLKDFRFIQGLKIYESSLSP
ncbi:MULTISPECIES: type II toxin-antitoxin system VapC family toxin [unclassified Microcoleus]|uniref:type II toxin-antitoxin system VapC family toxin n=1 Tax=unclassified Microcoleus TaxID=2642155 RepID=UPI00403F1490